MPDSTGDYNIVIDSDATAAAQHRFAIEVAVPNAIPAPLLVIHEDARTEVFGDVKRNGAHVIANAQSGTADVVQLWAGASPRAAVMNDGTFDVSDSGLRFGAVTMVPGGTPPVGTIVIIAPTYLSAQIALHIGNGVWKYWDVLA